MTISELTGPVEGLVDDRLGEIVDILESHLAADPDYSFQMAAYAGGERVLDVCAGPHLTRDSLLVPYSSSKVTIGLTIGLLVQRRALELDRTVASYWPAFAQAGKAEVTVRQLLSHQAGIPETWPPLTPEEVLSHHEGAARLAEMRPLWRPGSAFGYHGITIGNLADELIFQATGETLHEVYEREIRRPAQADVHLGLPADLEHRLVPLLPMNVPEVVPAEEGRHPLRDRVFGLLGGQRIDLAGDPRSWRFGNAAVSSTASASGFARLLAASVTGVEGAAPLLAESTVAVMGEQQVHGYDEVLAQHDRAFGVVFQRRSGGLDWGGPRSFGHDGAAGAVACVDPETGVAFGYTVVRGPWPGGADQRAVAIARRIGELAG
ncbi:MAG: serine hydrolase domain-containing protein [Naasia sp.]